MVYLVDDGGLDQVVAVKSWRPKIFERQNWQGLGLISIWELRKRKQSRLTHRFLVWAYAEWWCHSLSRETSQHHVLDLWCWTISSRK